jgi:hypothetical protein
MPVIKLRSHIGEDGMLHLDIPPEFKGQEVDVTVTFEPITEEENYPEEDLSHLEWHEFIEATAGCINDDTFFRHPQGEFPVRESLE